MSLLRLLWIMAPSLLVRVCMGFPLTRQTDFGVLSSAENPGFSGPALFVRYLSWFLFKPSELVTLSLNAEL